MSKKKKAKLNKNGILKENQKIFDRYQLHRRNEGLTEKSMKAICQNDIRLFLIWLRKKPLWDVNHDKAADFFDHCRQDRKNCDNTISRKFSSINTFYNILIVQEVKGIIRNPLSKLAKPKKRKKERPYLTRNEFKQLLGYVDSRIDLRGGALISLFYSSACRLSEIWQLNRDSLNMETRQFKVLGKGQKERMCIFSKDTRRRIQLYLSIRTDNEKCLFRSQQGGRLCGKGIQEYIKRTCKRAGIQKNITPHKLRHTRAMLLLEQGVELRIIQKLLGHESIATTQIYARTRMAEVKTQIDNTDDIEAA